MLLNICGTILEPNVISSISGLILESPQSFYILSQVATKNETHLINIREMTSVNRDVSRK